MPIRFSWQKWWTSYCCDCYELEPAIPDSSDSDSLIDINPYYDEQPKPKPVIEQRRVVYVKVMVVSCFPRNTKVSTLAGPVDIGNIKPGDRVLTQQPFTGELSYQPVLQVTLRRTSAHDRDWTG